MADLWIKLTNRTVEVESGCWQWQGAIGSHGYGQVRHEGKAALVHRLMYVIYHGEIPEGMFVLHKCDNRRCINPEHLFCGSAQDNTNDMINKGRAQLDNSLKLSDDQVLQIRQLLEEGLSQAYIASMFDISQATVSRINTRDVYGWV